MDVVPLRPEESLPTGPAARFPHDSPAPLNPPVHPFRLVRHEEPASRPAAWETLNAEGTQCFLDGRFAAARSAFEAALDTAREFPSNDLRLATSLNNLGETCRTLAQFDRAAPLLQEAAGQRERVLGERHPHVARSRNNLGYLHECRAEYYEAFGCYRDALHAMSRSPRTYPGELMSTLLHLARLAGVCGVHDEAQRLHTAAFDVMGVCIDESDPESGLHLCISGQIHEMGRRFGAAWHAYRSALRVLESALGSEHYLLAPVLAGMGRALRAREHTGSAERLLYRALAILETTFDGPHQETAGVLNSLGELYRATGRTGLAEMLYRRALKMSIDVLGDVHPDVAAVLHNFAMLQQQRGADDLAAELLVQVEQIDAAIQLPPAEAFERLSTATIGR